MEKFEALGLSEASLRELNKRGFEEPTEIQAKAIPLLLQKDCDIIGQAQTGTGKTAAFGLPILDLLATNANYIQALVLTPTRELAIQVSEEISSFKGKRKVHVMPVYGGQSMPDQLKRLKQGVDIVVGTPGRVYDHIKRGSIVLDRVAFVVLDEADEMLNMGFLDEVESILEQTPPERRTLLFSATMPDRIKEIAKNHMKAHEIITVKKGQLTLDLTDQIYFEVNQADKFESLCRIIDVEPDFYGLVFCRTKVMVDEVANRLIDRGYDADGIHGDLSQHQRERVMDKFKKKRLSILVATDVAARGIDVSNLSHVINFSIPPDPEAYVHRIGRTGRAGQKGVAITFISPEEYRKLMFITKTARAAIRKEKLPRASDIVGIKRSRIRAELNEIIESQEHTPFTKMARQLLKDQDPLDVVAALVKYSLEDELDASKYREIREVNVDLKGTSRLFVSLGKKDGLTPRKLVKFIQNQTKTKAGDITEVKVMHSFSFITVPFKEAENILKVFKGNKGPGQPVIKKAKENSSSK